jgi:hypothetical protein
VKWKVINNKRQRETPCCYQPVRVKIKEPGVQSRRCELCHAENWFVLEESPDERWKGMLFMRWISAAEARGIEQGIAESDLLSDVDIGML